MRHRPWSLLFSFATLWPALPAQAGAITWQTDLAAATKVAAEKHAPLLVVFRCER